MEQKDRIKFYKISDDYIEYLSKFDKHISWNKDQKRPYIGVILSIDDFLYFAPLYSYKDKYNTYKGNPSFMKVKDRKGRDLSIVRLAEMIPVPQEEVELMDFKERGDKYQDLLQAEREFINDNRESLYNKAKKIYRNVTETKVPFFVNIACNYKILEEKCKEWENETVLISHLFNYLPIN